MKSTRQDHKLVSFYQPLTAMYGIIWFIFSLSFVHGAQAKPDATTKFSVIREENPREQKETLILPYAFSSESMGTTIGVGGLAKGFLQDQVLVGGTAYGSLDDAGGIIGGVWDYRLPWTDRLFLTAFGSYAYYPKQRAYAEAPRRPSGSPPPPAGTNNSGKDNYIEDRGHDNWLELKLEYVLPLGSMKTRAMADYYLKNGILQSGSTGGRIWNPLESGVSILLLGQTSRYQSYMTETMTYSGDTFPYQLGYLYDNTDFPPNPTRGSSQYIALTRDFSSAVTGSWSFVEFEASKYIDLGPTDYCRQQVVALNFWTGTSPSWREAMDSEGNSVVLNKPPFFEGARLGGFYRMRGYPNNRFNDRSVIYTAAEYRYTLKWDPVAAISWLRWFKTDWFQFVGFIEGGRVAGEYTLSGLFSEWKVDGGIGMRAMMAGSVVRLDVAGSDEGVTAWVMFGQPF